MSYAEHEYMNISPPPIIDLAARYDPTTPRQLCRQLK